MEDLEKLKDEMLEKEKKSDEIFYIIMWIIWTICSFLIGVMVGVCL